MSRAAPRTVTAALLLAPLVVACSGDDAADRATASAATVPSAVAPTSGVAPSPGPGAAAADNTVTVTTGSTSSAADVATVPTSTPTSIATTVPATTRPLTPFAEVADASIELRVPATGNGPKPLLRWEPVPGAVAYHVIVNTLDGGPYWGWRGAASQVWLGGSPTEPAADTEGPMLVGPMLLTVVATGADGLPVAGLGPVEIAP